MGEAPTEQVIVENWRNILHILLVDVTNVDMHWHSSYTIPWRRRALHQQVHVLRHSMEFHTSCLKKSEVIGGRRVGVSEFLCLYNEVKIEQENYYSFACRRLSLHQVRQPMILLFGEVLQAFLSWWPEMVEWVNFTLVYVIFVPRMRSLTWRNRPLSAGLLSVGRLFEPGSCQEQAAALPLRCRKPRA